MLFDKFHVTQIRNHSIPHVTLVFSKCSNGDHTDCNNQGKHDGIFNGSRTRLVLKEIPNLVSKRLHVHGNYPTSLISELTQFLCSERHRKRDQVITFYSSLLKPTSQDERVKSISRICHGILRREIGPPLPLPIRQEIVLIQKTVVCDNFFCISKIRVLGRSVLQIWRGICDYDIVGS